MKRSFDNLPASYLSDCLQKLTGHTAQQCIHDKLIEQAKEILITDLSIGELANQPGFG